MSAIPASGTKAPGFTLRVTPDQSLSLSEFAERQVILTLSGGLEPCGDQMTLCNHVLTEFSKKGAELVGITVDGAWCHQAFARERDLHFPLLSDSLPKGEVARAYGAYRDDAGENARALVIVDENGTIAWSHLSPVAVNRGADGILDALDQMLNWSRKMPILKVPLNPRDHRHGEPNATVTLVEYGDYPFAPSPTRSSDPWRFGSARHCLSSSGISR